MFTLLANPTTAPCFHDTHAEFRADVIDGLSRTQRAIPCKYFYDDAGSRLFEEITEQPEYYVARAETALLAAHAPAIAAALGEKVDLLELGSGGSHKTRLLLDALRGSVIRYVPIDISAQHLAGSARQLRRHYPSLRVEPVVGDYSRDIEGVSFVAGARRMVMFLGASIGNFQPAETVEFLRRARELAGPRGVVLVAVDLPKDGAVLERAYDDAKGATAAFNLNLLHRMRRDLDARLAPSDFEHVAVWQPEHSRIEMRLRATRNTVIEVGEESFRFARGECIRTERCHKYDDAAFARLARLARLSCQRVWLDPAAQVSLHWLTPSSDSSIARGHK